MENYVWNTFKQIIFAIVGGFVGAIFGVVISGRINIGSAWILSMEFSLIAVFLIIIGDALLRIIEK